MASYFSRLKPYWQISFHCSALYLIIMVLLSLLFITGHFALTHSMFNPKAELSNWIIWLRAAIDTMLFFGSSHFILRPYLKLKLIPQGHFGWNLLPLTGLILLLGLCTMALTVQLSELTPFARIDLQNIGLQDSQAGKPDLVLKMSKPVLLLVGGLNQAIMYFLWTLAYLLWQALVSKKQMQQQMHAAQLQQLTNQLNPHFLFNALNSIRALIFEDQHKAATTVTQLAELFRVHLQAHLRPMSSLAEEWQVAEHYLQIEQVRLEQRLNVQLDWQAELWQQQLPTLTLLTLVENAVKHGISPNSQAGFIKLSSKTTATGWQLTVENSVGTQSQLAGTQTGLANLRQRLQLCSARHQLHYQQTEQQVRIIVELNHD